jgi:HK97 gp10 family phage protein
MIRATATFRPRSDLGRFVEARVTPAVRMGVQESLELIRDRAKELCPVDTGALQASITIDPLEEPGKTVVGRVGPHTDYDVYVEFGTGIAGASSAGAGPGPYSPTWPGMIAQPYMRPAIDESREKIKDIMAHNLQVAFK